MTSRKLTTREKTIAAVTITLLSAYVGYTYVFTPLQQGREDLKDRIASSERALKKNLRIIRRGKSYKARYDDVLSKFKQTVSDEEAVSSILTEIEKVANQAEMRISEMKPQKIKKETLYNKFSVSLTIDGAFTEVARFIHILQTDPYLFNIDEVRFDKVSKRTPKIKCRLILSKISIL